MKVFTLTIAILLPIFVAAQRPSKINKYAIGIEIDIGHSFITFDKGQDRWKGKFNPTGALNILFVNRINQKWTTDLGIGFTAYGLILRSKSDKYIIDFASPHLSTGISYNFQHKADNESFIKLATGFQLGYKGKLVDEFETYRVTIEGKNRLYQFIRSEIGVRRYSKQKIKGSRHNITYEFGAYFRYNLNTLGTASIEETDFEITLEPRGNILGGFFKVLLPQGRKRIKVKNKPDEILPPIIYNPRHMD